MPSRTELAVTATGLATSVGRSAATACAAIRASITRPHGARDLCTLDPETQDLMPLVGHPVHPWTEGFHSTGRWMRLARMCLSDLVASVDVLPGGGAELWRRAALVAVTRELDPDLFPVEDGEVQTYLQARFLRPLGQEETLSIPAENISLISSGPVGVARAIAASIEPLASGAIDRVVILAVDSWFHPVLIGRANGARRLKSADQPVGFVPGEAAAALLVETVEGALRRRARVRGVLDGFGLGSEGRSPIDGAPASGSGLVAAMTAVLGADEDAFEGDLIIDLNGESWRAHQWGMTLAKLGQKVARAKVHVPCVSIGDTGAAGGAVGLCLALEALHRRWARTDSVIVVANADSGESACIRVKRASA